MAAKRPKTRKVVSDGKDAKKRGAPRQKHNVVAAAAPPLAANPPVPGRCQAEVAKAEHQMAIGRAIDFHRDRANKGDRQSQVILIRFFNANPSLWESLGDMARHAEKGLIDTITKGEWLTGRAIEREACQLRERLSRPSQSPLEELAVQRLVACWVQLQFVESMCSRADGTVERGKFWLHRQAQAHRLYAAAEKSLLLIRGSLPGALPPQARANGAVSDFGSGAPASGEPYEAVEKTQFQEVPVVADFGGVNRIANPNGHRELAYLAEPGSANGNHHRVNGHGVAGILESIGGVASG